MLFKKDPVKLLGFIEDQQGIINRYLREKDHWDLHLIKSKDVIIDFFCNNSFRSTTILGSGWWLDLPIEYLSQNLEKVVLVDIIHPPQIIQKASRYSNVILKTEDITGSAGIISECLKKGSKEAFLEIPFNNFKFKIDTDSVISLNILDQLHALLFEKPKSQFQLSETEMHKMEVKVQLQHLDLLKNHKSLLIADKEELVMDHPKDQPKSKNLIFHPLPNPHKTWTWVFDTQKKYYSDKITHFKVGVYHINC